MVIKRKQCSVNQPPPGFTIEGAASFSPQNPISQNPISGFTGEPFPPGTEVEVKFSGAGFYNSWYEAKVLKHFVVTRWSKYKVQYLHLLSKDGSKQLEEEVNAKNVRPRRPRRLIAPDGGGNEGEDPEFKMHDLVEACHNEGWWHGVVSGLRNPETGLYTVSFPYSRDVLQFKPGEIRHHLDFVDGKWVPVLGETQKKGTFKEGDNVEVSQFRQNDYGPSYFPARVEKVIHNSYYLVKYESPNARPNGDLSEILDPKYLRPAVDCIPGTNRFLVNSHVEVFHKGGWSPGLVYSCLSGSDYGVTVVYNGGEITKHVNVSNMRLRLDWDGRKWCKWGSISKEKKRKPAHCSESFSSDVTLTEETTPDSVTSPSKKLKKERSEEVQELQSQQIKVTLSKDLESEEEVPITELFKVKSELSKSTSSSSPRSMHDARKVCQSRKLLKELKGCHSKISTRKRSSTCKRSLNIWMKQDEVNNDMRTTDKHTDVNLSNESSSNVPLPSTSCEKEAAFVSTVSCEKQQASTNYTADFAGDNAVGVSSHHGTMGHIVGSENKYMFNTRDSLFDDVIVISEGELVNSQPLNSSAIMEHLSQSQDQYVSSPSLSRLVATVDQAAPGPFLENSFLTELNPKSKFDKHTSEDNTPVKSVTSDIVLPFEKISPLWKTLETTLAVFSCIPQKPHFMKVESECKDTREGTAIGLMVTYANMAESIQRLSIHTEVTVFEEKIACLDSLEENGFIVDPIRNHLQCLLEIKTSCTKSAVKRVELDTVLANKEQENMSMLASANDYDSKLNDIRKSIAELEEKARAITEERAGILNSKEELQHDLERLGQEIASINRSRELSLEEFGRLISKPLY